MKLSVATGTAVTIKNPNRLFRLVLRQIGLQFLLILVSITVLFPIVWIFGMATDARGLPYYSELVIIPDDISLTAFQELLFEPFETLSNATQQVYLSRLFSNSLFVALGTAMLSVTLGASAAYAFSRYKFIGRQAGMLGFILLLTMPATGTIVPLIALFSLLKVHVLFSTLAPAIFYGALTALLTYGLISAVRNLFKHPIFHNSNLRYAALIGLVFVIFAGHFMMWNIYFRESDAYAVAIRDPLRATNEIRTEVQDMRVQLPRAEENVSRQERRLDSAEAEAQAGQDFINRVETVMPNALTILNGLSGLTTRLSNTASFTNPSLLNLAYNGLEVRSVVMASGDAIIADQALTVEQAKQRVEDEKAELAAKEQELEEAKRPYLEMRSKAIGKLMPYALLTAVISIVIAAGLWVILYQMRNPVELIQRERFGRLMLLGYILIVALVAYAWFDAYYESPTEKAGLEGGGLWYDIRLAFTSPDDILADLEPYLERDGLESSVAAIETNGLISFRLSLLTASGVINKAVTDMEAVNTELNPPDNLDRSEQIEWKDQQRATIRGQLEAIRSTVTKNEPFYLETTNRLNLLNNENFKREFLEVLRIQQGELATQIELVNSSTDQAVVLANFRTAIDDLPSNATEREKLEKEASIRTNSSNDVNETLKVTLFGLMIAYSSGALPFAIWNLKGYFDTIPKELEEAALVDGAGMISTFFRIILPLTLPALAITTLFGFMSGWTEFILATQFLPGGDRSTMAMALRGISGGGQTQADPDYTQFAAMSILMAIPVVTLFYIFQRWIVSGLTVGGVKG